MRKEYTPAATTASSSELTQETKPSAFAATEAIPTDREQAQISTLVTELVELEREQAKVEDLLKELKARTKQLSEIEIPDAMDSVGMRDFTLENGEDLFKVTVSDYVHAKIPDESQDEAYTWLEEHESGSIIKGEIKLPFPRGSRAVADALLALTSAPIGDDVFAALKVAGREDIADHLFSLNNSLEIPAVKETIHHKTLDSYVKQAIVDFPDFPRELFNIHEGRKTKTKIVKG
jgi:hypothetical protein